MVYILKYSLVWHGRYSSSLFVYTVSLLARYIQGGPKKSKPPPIFQKIALKIANEIRFLRKVKV